MLEALAARRSPWIGAAAIVLAFTSVASLVPEGPAHSPRTQLPDPSKLSELPAVPAEIAAHGGAANTILAPDAARNANAAVPFAFGPVVKAKPFKFAGSDEDRARALQCLASAALYEAGDDTRGEAAVAQVVLNRVRHAAFPATVCGVVYQGAERGTGCQFTFTCDGSLRRQMPDLAWRRAREVAQRALSGKVDAQVGLATHYHTDWVYPYWSPQLRKLARVATHLFFGWPGSWGGPYAFGRKYRGGETTLVAVANPMTTPSEALTPASAEPVAPKKLDQAPPAGISRAALFGNRLRLVHPDGGAFGLLTAAAATPAQLTKAALALCPGRGFCRVDAWASDDDIPLGYPLPPAARQKIVFEFTRDPSKPDDRLRFDCKRFTGIAKALCRDEGS